jgi:shikimate kinase
VGLGAWLVLVLNYHQRLVRIQPISTPPLNYRDPCSWRCYVRGMSVQRSFENLALIGFMGTGKSSVGRLAAQQLEYEFVDTDELIEQRAGKPITRIFAEDGERAFREWERQLVAEMAGWRHKVIATGGGLGANPEHLASMRRHALTICLWASAEVVWQRVRHQTHRPLLQDPDPLGRIRALLDQRTGVYRQADVLLNTGLRSIREVVQQVLHQFHLARTRMAGEAPH